MTKNRTTDSTPAPTVSPRSLAGGAAVLLGIAGAAKPAILPNPDAELIRLCAAFDVLEHRVRAAYDGNVTQADSDRADLVAAAIGDEQAPILDAITACRPSTLAGFKALANTLALWDAELLKGDPMQGYINDRLALVLFRGMTGHPSAVPPAPSPDAGLLALCAEFQRLNKLAYLEGIEDWEAAHGASWEVSDKIADMVPVTEAGHRAKAAVAVVGLKEAHEHKEFDGDRDAIFALNMLRDWLGRA